MSLSLLAAGILLVAGCSSTPTRVDTGPISARTFSFATAKKSAPGFADKNQQIHALVQGAITESLASRQVSRVERGGDITVAYLIIAGDDVTATMLDDYFGYGRDAERLLEVAHDKYTSGRNYFVAGTLLIDLIDTKSGQVRARGHATRGSLRGLSPEARAERVKGVAEEILARVRFTP